MLKPSDECHFRLTINEMQQVDALKEQCISRMSDNDAE